MVAGAEVSGALQELATIKQVGEGVYKAAFDLKRGSPRIETLVRREQAGPGMNVIQNGCAEMQAPGPAVPAWQSDLPEGALGDIEHAETKSAFVKTLSCMHFSSIEKDDFSLRRTVNGSAILKLFDSGIDETDRELVVPMRCECVFKVAGMKNLNASGYVDGRAPGLFLHASSGRELFFLKFRCSESLQNRNFVQDKSSCGTYAFRAVRGTLDIAGLQHGLPILA